MTNYTVRTSPEPLEHVEAIDGSAVPVDVAGPENGHTVVIFDETKYWASSYQAVRERLHIARVRTVLIGADHLTAKSAVSVLDSLQVKAAVLVGDHVGAELAWELAATHPERIAGLVVIECGHPRVIDTNGVIRDPHCPPVHADTTALVTSRQVDAVARASRRYVHGEYRLTELAGWRGSRYFTIQLTTEILLRMHSFPG